MGTERSAPFALRARPQPPEMGCTSSDDTTPENNQPKQRRIIIAGPPAGGKGSIAESLLKKYPGIQHLSTGDMLRAAVKAGTEAGKLAEPLMKEGKLVPDEVVIGCVRDALSRPEVSNHGFMLDGFPRSVAQSKALDSMLQSMEPPMPVDKMIVIEASDEDLKVRVMGRRIHKASGRSYHIKFKPPKEEGKDDVTGEPLETRSDDTEEAIVERIASYKEQTLPVVEHYKGRVITVQSKNENPPSATFDQVQKIL